jgi:hypothetical protein
MNEWIAHVKAYQNAHGCSYKDALKKASATYKKMGSGLMTKPADMNQMYIKGGNLKKASKANLIRMLDALTNKGIEKLAGTGAIGNMLKQRAADTTAQLIDAGGDRAASEMTTQGAGMHMKGRAINRLNKANRWQTFVDSTIRDAIDTAGKASDVYNQANSPMAKMGFGLKKHRKLRGKALLAAGY